MIYLLLAPIIFAVIIWFSKDKTYNEISRINLLSAALTLAAGIDVASSVLKNGSISFLNNIFYFDGLNAFIVLLIALVNFATALFSVGYMKKEFDDKLFGPNRVRKFYFQINVFIFAMLFASSVNNLGIFWIAIEMTTIATAFLISFYNRQTTIEAAWEYVIICSLGITIALFGTVLFYFPAVGMLGESFSALNWTEIIKVAPALNSNVLHMAFIFIIIGYGTKAGLAPMNTWMSGSYSKAPIPVVVLSGVLLTVAMYGIIRFKIIVDANAGNTIFTGNLLIVFGLLSLAVAAVFMLIQKNYRRALAFSSIEHMGVIAIGLGFGGPLGVFGALFHILNHTLAKAMMFFSAGNILGKYHSAKIAKVRGTLKVLPVTGIIVILGSLALAGSPPFNVFLSEFMILSGGISVNSAAVALAALFLAILFVGFIANMFKMLFGNPPENIPVGEENKLGLGTMVVIMSVLIILGFYIPQPLEDLLTAATNVVNINSPAISVIN